MELALKLAVAFVILGATSKVGASCPSVTFPAFPVRHERCIAVDGTHTNDAFPLADYLSLYYACNGGWAHLMTCNNGERFHEGSNQCQYVAIQPTLRKVIRRPEA